MAIFGVGIMASVLYNNGKILTFMNFFSRISRLDRSRIVTEEAYVLFYELSNQMSVL